MPASDNGRSDWANRYGICKSRKTAWFTSTQGQENINLRLKKEDACAVMSVH